jgi:hypothetical protein
MIGTIVMSAMLAWALASPGPLPAAGQDEDPQEMQTLRKEIERLARELDRQEKSNAARIEALEREIASLRERIEAAGSGGALPDVSKESQEDDLDALLDDLGTEDELDQLLGDASMDSGVPAGAGASAAGGSLARVFQSMNPDISVIGDFIGHYSSQEGGDLDDEFRFRELELGFSAAIDPYARADFFIGLGQDANGDWETELEEGYATFLTVPYDLQPRAGRFRSTFGKANNVHLHALPWVEYPLVIQNLFGEHGLSGDGAGLNWLVPNPWDRFIELTYEVTNNDNELFAGDEGDDFMHLVHFKSFNDFSDASTLEAGLSFATAPNDDGHGGDRTHVQGFDLTYKWRPPQAGIYRSFLWQTEVMAAEVDRPGVDETPWGMYSAVDYQFARRWTVGARYDYSQLPADAHLREEAYSGFLTFMQSEFLFWRLGYRYTGRNFRAFSGRSESEVFLQLNFGIGPHRAHKY